MRTEVTYRPRSNFVGTERLTYSIEDLLGRTSEATITIDIFPAATNYASEDVDQNGIITPYDALLVINELNLWGARPTDHAQYPVPAAMDVNRDGYLSPFDALQVINVLNLEPLTVWAVAESTAETDKKLRRQFDEKDEPAEQIEFG